MEKLSKRFAVLAYCGIGFAVIGWGLNWLSEMRALVVFAITFSQLYLFVPMIEKLEEIQETLKLVAERNGSIE